MTRARAILPWLVPPALAIIAYAPVLGMWFVADDFGHLLFNNRLPFPQPLLAFGGDTIFYRPFSTTLTWNLGLALFGRNAFPYHLVSLLLHALSAFLLSRLGYVVSGSMITGLLAGALFAVYPLTTEPVAWLASQWDLLGTVCVLGAALGFAHAWRNHLQGKPPDRPYILGLVSAFLAAGMKESTLPLAAVLPFVALAVTRSTGVRPPATGDNASPTLSPQSSVLSPDTTIVRRPSSALRAFVWSLPYAVPAVIFVLLRLVGVGKLGGYTNAPTDIQNFIWDALVKAFLAMLMPLNRLIFNLTLAQFLGLAMTALFFGLLIIWGKQKWPLLLLSLVWWLVFLVPAVNLLPGGDNPANLSNRIYYLSLIGFCLAISSLIAVPLEWPRSRTRQAVWAAVGLTLLLAIPVTWKQLEPWTQASRQTRHLVDEITAMLSPRSEKVIQLNAHSLPREYDGAYVFWNGLDTAIQVFHRQRVHLFEEDSLDSEALPAPLEGHGARWNLDFTFDPRDELFYVDGLSGISENTDPPTTLNTRYRDFRVCTVGNSTLTGWQAAGANAACKNGYLNVTPTGDDPSLTFSNIDLDLTGARWLRLGVAVRYSPSTSPHLAEWYWTDSGGQLSEERTARYYISHLEDLQVYWTYIKADRIGNSLRDLRFDPANANVNAQISWIALTPIIQP